MKNYLFLSLFIMFGFVSSSLKGQTDSYSKAILESTRMLDSIHYFGKVPGLDVAVAIDGKIVWSKGFGYADLEHRVPVSAGKTLFRIGSVSKPLTSASLGILMDRNMIDIDNTVQTYSPGFPEKEYPLTVKQIGGHIGGIRHYRGKEMLSNIYYPSVDEGLRIFSKDALLFQPGTSYSYSSYGYNLLSSTIEGAAGEDFLTFIQREVFDALKMSSTTPDINRKIIEYRTSFYELDEKGNIVNATYVDNSYKWAGGGFISNTLDMVKFGQAHMQAGFLSEETLKELTSSQTLKNGKLTGYGVGWRVLNNNGLKGYGHSGGSVGGITQFQIYPEKKMVIVFLSNSSDTNYGNVVNRVVKLFAEIKK